ncbi:hypothetical protein [Microcoleus sp. herbarium12]|uniref:hypothetical protein n=1 Tax=Microcoleus sp. herbarium12 TaxID=3055437 RepID=UPI002FD53164
MTTGLALIGGFACCFEARRAALKLSQAEDFEAMKEAVIIADTEDELATSAYISEQQRRMEAEGILNAGSEREDTVEALKRAWLLDCGSEPSEPGAEPLNQPTDNALVVDEERFTSLNLTKKQACELIEKMRNLNLNQKDIIEKLWSCTKGGSTDWKAAREIFRRLTGE